MNTLRAVLILCAMSACTWTASGILLVWNRWLAKHSPAPPLALRVCRTLVLASFASNAVGVFVGLIVLASRIARAPSSLGSDMGIAVIGTAVTELLLLVGFPWFFVCSVRWPTKRTS